MQLKGSKILERQLPTKKNQSQRPTSAWQWSISNRWKSKAGVLKRWLAPKKTLTKTWRVVLISLEIIICQQENEPFSNSQCELILSDTWKVVEACFYNFTVLHKRISFLSLVLRHDINFFHFSMCYIQIFFFTWYQQSKCSINMGLLKVLLFYI